MIKQIGYKCDIAVNGEEALKMHLKKILITTSATQWIIM